MSMVTVDDYILGDVELHARFRLATEILGVLLSNSPLPVSTAHLEAHTGQSPKAVAKSCISLVHSMLIRPDETIPQCWILVCDPTTVTLEDVFRCVITQPDTSRTAALKADDAYRIHHDVDLLLMQATMAINQSVFKHLRQFPLDRLRVITNDDPSIAALPKRRRATKIPRNHIQPELS